MAELGNDRLACMSLSVPLAAQVRKHCDHHAHHDVHHDTGSVHRSSMLICLKQQQAAACVAQLSNSLLGAYKANGAVSGMLRCAAEGAGFE